MLASSSSVFKAIADMKARVPGLLSLFLEHIVRNRKRDCYQKNQISKNCFCASSRIVATKKSKFQALPLFKQVVKNRGVVTQKYLSSTVCRYYS